MLIGRPESKLERPDQDDPIETLFDQLRQRRLAEEQKETFAKQEEAAVQLKELNDAQAAAEKQTELTQTRIDVEIAGNRGEAQLAEAERLAERDVARAEGESRAQELLGRGEALAHRADRPRGGRRLAPEDPRLRRPAALRAQPGGRAASRTARSRSSPSGCS